MAKDKTVYVCRDCGYDAPKWSGQCPNCGAWNTMAKTTVPRSRERGAFASSSKSKLLALDKVASHSGDRIVTGISEFDRVLGGGFVPGQVILLTGEPGIGKSTLLLQVANSFGSTEASQPVLYVSGEESPGQIKLRAERLGIESKEISLLSETNLNLILESISDPQSSIQSEKLVIGNLVIVDSIQTLTSATSDSAAGTVSQVRDSAQALSKWAKDNNVPLILVGHVTKSGSVAGPKVLEHLVDTVLFLEGDKFRQFRLLRSLKNRFGSVDEVGVFKMGEQGMQEVANPSDMFLSERQSDSSGSAVTVVMEGTRPMLLEVQALVSPSPHSQPRRVSSGFPYQRLLMLCAVLEKSLGLSLNNKDVYVNVASGAKVKEPAADLAVISALYSTLKDKPTKPQSVVFGEVGLSGEVRSVSYMDRRVQEAEKMGFSSVLSPSNVRSVREAVKIIVDSGSG